MSNSITGQIIVSGFSDDCIEIDGALSAEFDVIENDEGSFIFFSDGTVVKGNFDFNVDAWDFKVVKEGNSMTLDKTDKDINGDVSLTFSAKDISWVGCGTYLESA